MADHPGATLVYETVAGEGPVLLHPDGAFALSFVPGRDGIAVTLGDRTEYLTPDDLLARQAFDQGFEIPSLGFKAGLDVTLALAILADRFETTVPELLDRARVRRIRVVRSLPGEAPPRVVTAETMTRDDVRDGAIAAARFLARGVDAKGRFRYLVDAPTNRTLPGYDWPRHAGATYFLAQAAALADDPELAGGRSTRRRLGCAITRRSRAAIIAASATRGSSTSARRRSRSSRSSRSRGPRSTRRSRDLVPELAAFLRAQQRPDGEFMHQYDRAERQPIDVQLLYYSGEAALALSRAALAARRFRATSTPRAARSPIWWAPAGPSSGAATTSAKSTGPARRWKTCGIARPTRRPSTSACAGRTTTASSSTPRTRRPYDAEGAYGFGPLVTPRLTPVGSRTRSGHRDARCRLARASRRRSRPCRPRSSRASTPRCADRSPCCFAISSAPASGTSLPRLTRSKAPCREARSTGSFASTTRSTPGAP